MPGCNAFDLAVRIMQFAENLERTVAEPDGHAAPRIDYRRRRYLRTCAKELAEAACAAKPETEGARLGKKYAKEFETGSEHAEDAGVLSEACLALVNGDDDPAATFRETVDRGAEGEALNDLGIELRAIGRLEDAVIAHQQAAAIFREVGDRRGEGIALNDLGVALLDTPRLEDTVIAQQKAAAIFREIGNRRGESIALNNLGNIYQRMGRFGEAITSYRQDITIYREIGDRYGEGRTLNNLGDTYQEMRQPGQAARCWREAATAMRYVGDHKQAASLAQKAANAQSRWPRWRQRTRRSSKT